MPIYKKQIDKKIKEKKINKTMKNYLISFYFGKIVITKK